MIELIVITSLYQEQDCSLKKNEHCLLQHQLMHYKLHSHVINSRLVVEPSFTVSCWSPPTTSGAARYATPLLHNISEYTIVTIYQ